MGIFDKILRAIGFEDEGESEKDVAVEKADKTKRAVVNSKFDLKNMKEELTERERHFYNPKSQFDIEEIAKDFLKGNDAKIDFTGFSESDRIRALDFLAGAVFILNGKIEKIDKNIYLLKNKEN